MKHFSYTFVVLLLIASCKREIEITNKNNYLQNIKKALKDSLDANDFSSLDLKRAVLSKVDSVHLYYLRIPFLEKQLRNDFVIVRTDRLGVIKEGKIVHLEGKESEYGEGRIKQRKFDGNITISSLNRKDVLRSPINGGYIAAFHSNLNSRVTIHEPVHPVNVLPEVVVVAYIDRNDGISFSTWLWLNSFFYNAGTGGGSYYGSIDGYGDYGGGGGSSYGGGSGSTGSSGSGDTGGSPIREDEPILVDIDTYVNNEAIDVEQYLKCFENIPDDGATCTIRLYADIPVDSDPTKIFNWQTESPGHVFIELKKSNGTQHAQQSFGFYPKANWKSILNADPVDSKIVNDGNHEFNAALKMDVNPFLFSAAIGKIKQLSSMKYDMDQFNCTDFALEVFNYVRTPLEIPKYVVPGGIHGTNTPQGLYIKLLEMWRNNDPEAKNITIDILKGYVGGSTGPCN